ncbi:MAG: ComEC/Rec2 family competence protein [Bdellovibrionaceae bacterium]|nr:ComEC/Rec2 family competence protein [Pseudobdellovibrionaceae bacterium]
MLSVISLFSVINEWGLLTYLAPLSSKMHEYCLNMLPKNSSYLDIHKALICSHSLYNSDFLIPIKQLGLLHLFVVSGFHLNILYQWLKIGNSNCTKFHLYLIRIILLLYSLFCSLKAPILRAYIQFIWPISLNTLSQKIFYVGSVLLAIEPSLWCSLSLQLSWISALIITHQILPTCFKLIFLYLFIYIFLSPLALAHPLSILATLLLTPIIAYFLLPLSFLNIFFSILTMSVDFIWSIFLKILTNVSNELPLILPKLNLDISDKWQILFVLNFVFIYWEIHEKRKSLCASS